jgi:glycine/D-amino acid oxidase-like deaminating enzyme
LDVPIVVAGAGPLGAATAYHLARRGVQVAVVSQDRPDAAFRNSGGSICWHRPDPRRAAAIRETADFVRAAVADGARIRCRDVPYLFLNEGVQVPALNVDSGDLVDHLLAEAEREGARRVDLGAVTGIVHGDDGHIVVCDGGAVRAGAVVVALGAGNRGVVDRNPVAWEKRQLFVLDLPVGDDRAGLPHTIAAVGDGYAYVFVKRFDVGLRVVVGQERVVEDDVATGQVDHFDDLLDAGVADHFPFLREATVERVLWGLDWPGKLPHVEQHGPRVFSVNCGSAVRACIAGGRAAADAVTAALD